MVPHEVPGKGASCSGVIREEVSNAYGSALRLRRRVPRGPLGCLAVPSEPLENRLDLVRGVGPQTRERLQAMGYTTLAELARHPRFGKAATGVWAALARRDARKLLGAGARDVDLLPLFRREEAAVVDIETAGLARVLPVFLIGVALPVESGSGRGEAEESGWELRQYLARGFEEEAAILRQVAEEIEDRLVCVSYNGKAFDEPFVRERFRLHGLKPLAFRLHVDLLHACRRRFAAAFPDCRLTTMAKGLLGMEREDDISGAEAPDLYYRYIRDGDEEAIAQVLEHNAADLHALAWLFDAFWAGPGASETALAAEGGDGGETCVS